jgi:ubiquinone/menaquinone biosynthesis C-methylase UbiE
MKKEVFEHYEGLADRFDDVSNKYCNERYRKEVARFVGHEDTILDIGCGTGLLLSKLAARRRIGIDLSRGLLGQLGQLGEKKLILLQADAENLPFREGSFDVACSVNILEHVPHPKRVVSEGLRVIKKGGRLVLITPNGDMGLFLEIADALHLKAPEGPHRFLGTRGFKRIVAENGMGRILESKKFVILPNGPKRVLSLFERLEPHLPIGFFHLVVLEKR